MHAPPVAASCTCVLPRAQREPAVNVAADPTGPVEALQRALQMQQPQYRETPLQLMADKGLAHHHVRLVGTGLIARLPKQSQMGLAARANLDYQAACFERASASGHAPALHALLAPSSELPRGGLLVQEIIGRPARLPDDLPAIARALAAFHSLPLPRPQGRAPLLDPADGVAALCAEIDAQAQHLDAAGLAPHVLCAIDLALLRFRSARNMPPRPPRRLISFDAHPGNFLIRTDGSAVLVDLEKARYGEPPLDLAHATLYTSTTWDVDTHAELTPEQVAAAYAAWGQRFADAAHWRPWLIPLRTAMWLWAVTWCAKWRVLSERPAEAGGDGEDWSGANSNAALVAHVRGRVECYLSADIVDRVVAELIALEGLLG